MARFWSTAVLVIWAIIMVVSSSTVTVHAGGSEYLGWVPAKASCDSSIGECLGDEEYDMDSEISRRILATSKYISYGALQRNTVPCSRRGASYYNCKAGAQANPYNRGCSNIARCRS